MIIGSSIFILFTKLDMTSIKGFGHKVVLKTASATFGVYLIHENMFWYRLIWPTIAAIFPTPNSFISTVSVAFAIVLAVFISLSLIGFIADTIIVHPLTKIILKGWDTPHHTN